MNRHVLQRLAGIQQILAGVHASGSTVSTSSRGTERETFINAFLANVFPNPFRFGHGDITDRAGNRSGQVDVVVEYPFLPSLPVTGGSGTRLYLAEGVAAAIEVKSDVSTQWKEVLSTANQLSPIRRAFGATLVMGQPPTPQIPLFAVGYKGWQRVETVQERIRDGAIGGVLVLDPGIFVGSGPYDGIVATGPWALWGLIGCMQFALSSIQAMSSNPLGYATPDA